MNYTPHPLRVQRRRIKGFRLPPGTTCVTRPGRWSNCFDTAEEFRVWFKAINDETDWPGPISISDLEHMERIVRDIKQLRGFKLACDCPLSDPCHADTLAREANK